MKSRTGREVSVIVAAWNSERTIGATLESVLSQSMGNLEIIVCDDASSDKTSDVVRSFDDDRIKLITNPTNLGAGPSRDRAIADANANWIAFIDADDVWLPTRLEVLLKATNNECDVAVFDD